MAESLDFGALVPVRMDSRPMHDCGLTETAVPAPDVQVGDRRHRLRRLRDPHQRRRPPRLRALQRHARRARLRQGTQLRHPPR